MIYRVFILILICIIVANFIKPTCIWIKNKKFFSVKADANSMYKVTKVFCGYIFQYQLWCSNNKGKSWRKLGMYTDIKSAINARNGYIANNSIVDGSLYDPSHLLNEGKEG